MKRILIPALCCLVVVASALSCKQNNKKAAAEQQAATEQAAAAADSLQAALKAQKTMDKIAALDPEPLFDIVTNYGVITVKLYAKTPKHRENFAKLAFDGFYENTLFHRVINGFMIQAGDPLTKDPQKASLYGTGGPGYTVPAEFVPEYKHKKGALAAARRGDAANPLRESSGSQFYLVQDPQACAQLDGQYTVFGETVQGIDVIDKIAAVETGPRDRPVNPVKIITVKLHE